jgi:hypothetical protein
MRLTLAIILLALSSVSASGQDRLGVGASVTHVTPRSDELTRSPLRLGPLVRLQPGDGWGFAGAFNWFDTDVDGAFAGVNGELGELRIKPLMGGVGYTIPTGRVRTTFSVVGGPAWNELKINEAVRNAFAALGRDIGESLDEVSLAVRPGVGVSVRIAPRVDLTTFGGYLFNRPKFTVPTPGGDVRNDWTTDAVVLSIGAVFVVF